jgi:hypothetical protein
MNTHRHEEQCGLAILKAWIVFGVASATMTGCAPVYIAPAAHAPLFDRADEFHAAGLAGTNGLDGQVAMAINDRVGVVGSGSFAPESEDGEEHVYGEGAIAWFVPTDGPLRIEFLGGLGYGSSRGQYDEEILGSFSARGDYLRPFVQVDLGLASKYLEFALVPRLVYVDYRYKEINQEWVSSRENALFAEPMLVFRAGSESIKAELQCGLVLPFSDSRSAPEWWPLHVSLGIRGSFGGSAPAPVSPEGSVFPAPP